MTKKQSLRELPCILLLLAATMILFYWYTTQNSHRVEEQNRNYAADSARIASSRIDEEFNNARNQISSYASFVGEILAEPDVTTQMLKTMEDNSKFDAILFTSPQGIEVASDGQTANVSDRDYYAKGIRGENNMSIIFDPYFFDETIACFYAPVRSQGRTVGVLRGVYRARSYLQDLLTETYFGEQAGLFLCTPEGEVFAGSDDTLLRRDLVEALAESGVIDDNTVPNVRTLFTGGGNGVFACAPGSETDNLCVTYMPDNDYVFVQAFPKNVTRRMVDQENMMGILLELALVGLFSTYIIYLLVRHSRGNRQMEQTKQEMEQEKLEMGYIISGVNTLFSRFAMVDLETNTYQYLSGTRPEDSGIAVSGRYDELSEYLCSIMIDENARQEFAFLLEPESIVASLAEGHDDLRFECHVLRDGQVEWEHVNVICLERREGRAVKILFIRQNITEIKEAELHIQAEMSLADRKERQYRIAITSNAYATFEFNLTQDLIEQDVVHIQNGEKVSFLDSVGLQAPCKISDCFARWKQFVLEESMEDYCIVLDLDHLKERFEQGESEVSVDYWAAASPDDAICIRQHFIMTRDYDTEDIMVMVVSKDITSAVRKQREDTRKLQELLKQAQHANRAKSTFLSNMSHDIRTPMNAIIGFATIAATHIDNREQVKDCLQKVLSSSNHLLSLINDILDMSRIESGKVQLKVQECNISEIMHNLVNIIQPQVKAKQLQLFIDTFDVVNEDVIADALKINQVFINLMSNAVKYTPAGGTVTLRIMQHTGFRHGYGEYTFIVKDTGIGMAPEFVEHIFEPFERESTATLSGIQGTGLGMAITKNIVEMMDGTITVESTPGQGSTFTVTLTLEQQDTKKTSEQLKELEGLRALVVDDDFHVCDSVSKMLKQIGLRAEWTTSGREAAYRAKLACEDGDSFHTYIIDWQMPELNGVETARKIRQAVGEHAPIIILTAYDWSDIEEEARSAGVTAFCAKPLFMSDLKSALLVANQMSGHEQEAPVWTTADFTGKRVLLVEDIELNREIAEVILSEAGFLVETAPDGTDAVGMVAKSPEQYYDVILMDVQMPIMDGYEATRTIRRMAREDVKAIPIIAMTANALEEDREAALANGMNAHISKPLDMELFISVLGRFL